MKCHYCGNEIADDSVFCEYCGKKVVGTKKLKPLWITLAMLLVLSVIGGVAVVFEQTLVEKLLQYQQGNGDYVDLGLPSGTLWKDKNESGFYTYGDAVSTIFFDGKLPTKEQLEELKNSCTWTWRVIGYKVVGPNGNSIFLPAAGYRDGSVYDVGSHGDYWSSSPNDYDSAWNLYFYSGGVYMNDSTRCDGRSVRLVQ